MATFAMARVPLASLVALLLSCSSAVAHVCPPCLCDVLQKRSVGAAVATCASQQERSVAATNRTLQLLETLALAQNDISGCVVNNDGLQDFLLKAKSAHEASVQKSSSIINDIMSFATSSQVSSAGDFDTAMQLDLLEMGSAAYQSALNVSVGVGAVLESCFQTQPIPLTTSGLGVPAVVVGPGQAYGSTAMIEGNIALAWTVTIIAGLSTIVGAALVGIIDAKNTKLLSFLNALTAGVMIQGSLAGLANEALALASDNIHPSAAFWSVFICFFGGAGVCAGLEVIVHRYVGDVHDLTCCPAPAAALVPQADIGCCDEGGVCNAGSNSSDRSDSKQEESSDSASNAEAEEKIATDEVAVAVDSDEPSGYSAAPLKPKQETMSRQSVIVLIAGVTLHNIAEGMATFIAALANKQLGIAIAIGMVLHNIPEGFAISVPWYHATGSRLQGFFWASVAGVAEILAAFCIYLVILTTSNVTIRATVFSCLFAVAGGMMTFIALHELYPSAVKMSPSTAIPTAGLFTGLAIMQLALGQLGIPK